MSNETIASQYCRIVQQLMFVLEELWKTDKQSKRQSPTKPCGTVQLWQRKCVLAGSSNLFRVSRSRRISQWPSPSGEHQADISSAGKPRRRKSSCEKDAAQLFSVEEHRRPRRRERRRIGGQNARALRRKRRWLDASLSIV